MKQLAIVALTPNGLQLAQRLAAALGRGEVRAVQGAARTALEELFRAGRPLVCVMALGIVVRLLGPLASNKRSDPPVVVMDEAGRFAISVLGGHEAGANELACEVARALGAVPVITTASDVLGQPAVDLIGREWGWKLVGRENLVAVAAAVVRGERIGVYQDAGRRDWWRPFGSWPANFQHLTNWPPETRCDAYLVISDRADIGAADVSPAVIFRPPTLVLGVGCRRGASRREIEALLEAACRQLGRDPQCLGMVATATLKADEPGLREFAACHEVPVRTFTLDQLGQVPNLPTPSETVRRKIGIHGVAEPAALLAAGSDQLALPKLRGQRVVVAVARRGDV